MKNNACLDFESQLHTVPVRNESVVTYPDDRNPEVLVAETQLKYRGLLRLLAGVTQARKVRRYELTGLSRELYARLDGKLTVEDLILAFSEEEQLTFLEARSLINHYLRDLMQRGLIVIFTETTQQAGTLF